MTGFRAEDGAEARIRRLPAPDGERYQLSLDRRMDGRLVTLVVEIDTDTYRPRLKRLRLEDGAKVVEVLLVAEQFRAVSPGRFELALFRPDRSLLPPTAKRLPLPPPLQPPVTVVDPLPEEPSLEEIRSMHLRLAHALHRAQLCGAGEIEIFEVWGGLLVRGAVADPQRKAEYEAVLGLAALPNWVTFDLINASEAAALVAART
ncbi:MAG: hypothetical protein GY953_09990, partial [bacterium]|nr:hypothetical protein [bacterium]